jgi:hypothetical protein
LKILRGRGVKSPRNRRDSVEKTQNHLESPWPPQEMEWKRKKTRVLRGLSLPLYRLETRDLDMSGPGAEHVWLAGYVRAIGRTCPVKTASTVLESSETARKMIFNRFWRRANRIYICVAHGQVLTKKIYGLKPFE